MKTIQDVADEMKVSTSYVRRLVREGKLPALRVGQRLIRIREEDLQRFLNGDRKTNLSD